MLNSNLICGLLAAEGDGSLLSTQLAMVAGLLAVLIVPFVIGSFLAKSFRMPNYGTRLGIVLFAILSSVVVLSLWPLKYGVDLSGGTILVYEIDPTAGSDDPNATQVSANELVGALTKRINPSGTLEISIRAYGDRQIEIIVPNVEQREVERIKKAVQTAGVLEFAIVANERDDVGLIELVRSTGTSRRDFVTDEDGKKIGWWVKVDRESKTVLGNINPLRVGVLGDVIRNSRTGELLNPPRLQGEYPLERWLREMGVEDIDVLMRIEDGLQITGGDVAVVRREHDGQGGPAVGFAMGPSGQKRFYTLTLHNSPDGAFLRRLGIVLDGTVLSAPVIRSAINGDGQITGNFTQAEVDFLVGILRAGKLPAALSEDPISENQIGSTLGDDTISKGMSSIGISLLLVLVFILVYYRFAGAVACFALLLNLAMIVAVMKLINQPATLPGLAGLVLTVGMSVDANVLIFERIREELRRGAAARMAIRNGFARATTTIVDANLTTLITAIVLYAIGTDQVRGFAVALILGILFSMFTAIYVSRTCFDVAERWGWVSLGMSDFVTSIRDVITGKGEFDFIGKRTLAMVASSVLIVCGLVAIFQRGSSIFDIDFAGGTSVTFWMKEGTDADTVRKLIDESLNVNPEDNIQFSLNRVDMEGMNDRVFAIYTSVEDVNDLKDRVREGFANNTQHELVTFEADINPTQKEESPADATGQTGLGGLIRQVAYRPQDDENTDPGADEQGADETAEAPDAEPTATPSEDTEPAGTDTEPAGTDTEPAGTDTEPAGTDTEPASTDTEPASTDTEPASTDSDTADSSTETDSTPNVTIQSSSDLVLSVAEMSDRPATINSEALIDAVMSAAKSKDIPIQKEAIQVTPHGEDSHKWTEESNLGFDHWTVSVELPAADADQVMGALKAELDSDPVWLSSSKVGGRVASDMTRRAIAALLASLLFIVAYIWFRFQRVAFGLAAVTALIHDVLVTIGAIAISGFVAGYLGFLLIDEFRISLAVVAALLTIIGYSLNDTIVVFDRIREVRGKSPDLTAGMINTSINQTLSRTLLTSITTLIVVVLLYVFGGEGIHSFAFALTVGVIVGTYSSIFVASPTLLWLFNRTAVQTSRR